MVSFCCSNQATSMIQETGCLKCLLVPQHPQEITRYEFLVCSLPSWDKYVFPFSLVRVFSKTQSNSVAYGNGICSRISSSSTSSSSWMEFSVSSCSDSTLVSKSCSSRKKLPKPYSFSCAFVSAGETWGDPRTKPANLMDFGRDELGRFSIYLYMYMYAYTHSVNAGDAANEAGTLWGHACRPCWSGEVVAGATESSTTERKKQQMATTLKIRSPASLSFLFSVFPM